VPGEVCPGAHCGRTFHRRCLREWLQSIATTTCAFDAIFGECPWCGAAVSVRGGGGGGGG
jgi:E3 ubiquitin-protein ligase FANCL